ARLRSGFLHRLLLRFLLFGAFGDHDGDLRERLFHAGAAAARTRVEPLQHHVLADAGLADDEIVDRQVVIVFGVGDGRLQHLLHYLRDALGREGERVEGSFGFLAADRLRHQIQFARRRADVAPDGLGLIVRKDALESRLAHYALFAFLSPPALWPWNVRVGENSPSLWPTMSSVTSTGMCFLPL